MNLFRGVARALHKEGASNNFFMKTNQPRNQVKKSTYAMLLQSEEKERGLFETLVYSLLVVSAVVGIWQVAHLRVPSPFANTEPTAPAQVVSGS